MKNLTEIQQDFNDQQKETEPAEEVIEIIPQKRGYQSIQELQLNPCIYVPFQNAKLNNDHLLIKVLSQQGRRLKEDLKIEPLTDFLNSNVKRAEVGFSRQTSKTRHPHTKFSTQQPIDEQCINYPKFAQMIGVNNRGSSRCHQTVTPKGMYCDIGCKSGGHKSIIDVSDIPCEIGDYTPQSKRPRSSFISMKKATDRQILPQGRPNGAPNLIKVKQVLGQSVDPIRVRTGHKKLGHV